MNSEANRKAQLEYILDTVAASETDVGPCLLLGDMNFGEAAKENRWLADQYPDLKDCWTEVNSRGGQTSPTSEPAFGHTILADDFVGQPERIDRIFFRNFSHHSASLRPTSMRVVDGSEFSTEPPRLWSDHSGLVAEFEFY